MAVVVPRDPAGFSDEELIAFCEGELARYKIPQHVI